MRRSSHKKEGSGSAIRHRVTAGHIGFSSLNITAEDLVEPPSRRLASLRMDLRPDKLLANREAARDAYARFKGIADQRHRPLGELTGLLDQDRAVKERLWFEQELHRVLGAHRHRLRRGGVPFRTFLVH